MCQYVKMEGKQRIKQKGKMVSLIPRQEISLELTFKSALRLSGFYNKRKVIPCLHRCTHKTPGHFRNQWWNEVIMSMTIAGWVGMQRRNRDKVLSHVRWSLPSLDLKYMTQITETHAIFHCQPGQTAILRKSYMLLMMQQQNKTNQAALNNIKLHFKFLSQTVVPWCGTVF